MELLLIPYFLQVVDLLPENLHFFSPSLFLLAESPHSVLLPFNNGDSSDGSLG